MHIPTLDELKAIAGGVKVAFEDALVLAHAIPVVKVGIEQGKPALQVLAEEAPAALAIIESVANIAAPGSGELIQLLATAYAHAKPMNRNEEEAWFRRTQGTS